MSCSCYSPQSINNSFLYFCYVVELLHPVQPARGLAAKQEGSPQERRPRAAACSQALAEGTAAPGVSDQGALLSTCFNNMLPSSSAAVIPA